jgi:hypothetical protein
MSHAGNHVHEVEDRFVISSNHCWRPGSYATREAAAFAFKFCDDELIKLRDRANAERRTTTLDELRAHEPRVCAGCARWVVDAEGWRFG